MVKYKSTSNHFATEHPGLRERRITYKVGSQTTDPFSTAKTIKRKLPKTTKHCILVCLGTLRAKGNFPSVVSSVHTHKNKYRLQ